MSRTRKTTAKEEKRTNRRLRGMLDERRRELEELDIRATGEINTLKERASSLEDFRGRSQGFAPSEISGGNIQNNVFVPNTITRTFARGSMRLRSAAASREGATEEEAPRTYLRTADELLFSTAQTGGRSSAQDEPVGEYVSVSLVLTPHATT